MRIKDIFKEVELVGQPQKFVFEAYREDYEELVRYISVKSKVLSRVVTMAEVFKHLVRTFQFDKSYVEFLKQETAESN